MSIKKALVEARAVAPVETPDIFRPPASFNVYQEGNVPTRLTAEQWLDRQDRDEGAYIWDGNWTYYRSDFVHKLLEAFRDKSESQEIMLLEHEKESWRASYEKEWKVAAGLREEIERLKGVSNSLSDELNTQVCAVTELRAKLAEQERIAELRIEEAGAFKEDNMRLYGVIEAAEAEVTDAYDAIFGSVPQALSDNGEELSVADKITILVAEVAALRERERKLRSTVEWIAAQQDLFFAECSQAEEIIARCKDALACHVK